MGDEDEGEPQYKLYVKGETNPREAGSRDFTGQGTAEYKTGDKYEGDYFEGKRQGKGFYTFAKNGDTYEGGYEDNMKSGFGKAIYTNKKGEDDDGGEPEEEEEGGAVPKGPSKYLGVFSNNQRGCKEDQDPSKAASEGTFSYYNGDVYVGQWRAGKKHGSGSYTYAKDETKLVGEWENGKITSGRWIFPNGTFYCGPFRYNKPCGKGVWVFRNGNQLTGEYVQKVKATDDDADAEADADAPKKDPEVSCSFNYGKPVVVQGGTMLGK
jgi:hypothetical protein